MRHSERQLLALATCIGLRSLALAVAAPPDCVDSWVPECSSAFALRPGDIPALSAFVGYVPGAAPLAGVNYSSGVEGGATFHHLSRVVTLSEVRGVLRLVNRSSLAFDADPDTVDGMATHELFHMSPDLYDRKPSMKLDSDPAQLTIRRPVRKKLQAILGPILEDRITPFVRAAYPEICGNADVGRGCTPCYSLIRRYKDGERRSHAPHYDGHALVTMVVSLTEHGVDYQGGIYVAAKRSSKRVLELGRGDAVVHQSNLLHGVQVDSGERWSWIVWFRDSATCDDHSHEWFRDCAVAGDPVCAMLHASKVGATPGLSKEETARQMLDWNQRAADGGVGNSAIKLARAYLKQLPSSLEYDASKAAALYRRGIETSQEPDAYYGLAAMLLERTADPLKSEVPAATLREGKHARRFAAVRLLLEGAARAGHAFAAFNLGMVYLYGYGVPRPDQEIAGDWFEMSGIPEGLAAVAMHREATGRSAEAAEWWERAKAKGYGTAWRKRAREATGSGGATGVDLNLAWPLIGGRKPPPW